MRKAEALELSSQLRALVPDYPGASPDSLRAAERIAFRFRIDERATAYLREKVGGVMSSLGIYCSARKWRQYDSPEQVRGFLMNDLAKLEMAIQSAYPD